MYRKMNAKKLEVVIDEVKEWNRMKELVPEGFKGRYLTDGKLSDLELKSEYERGFVDCWNFRTLHRS